VPALQAVFLPEFDTSIPVARVWVQTSDARLSVCQDLTNAYELRMRERRENVVRTA